MKYLVTGGAGFIGSHLVERLLDEGHKVIVIDNLSEGSLSNLPMTNPNLEFHNLDIRVNSIGLFSNIDAVFHLAAVTRPQESIENPEEYNNVNVNGTLNILKMARDARVKRVVFASSASAYGEQESYPCLEEAKLNPMSPYALQKQVGEQYCKLFTNIYGLETNCLRFFNVYGNRMNPDSPYSALIPGFIKKIKNGVTPTIFGTGEQARDFCYVDDVVEAIILASRCEKYGEVFNVGWGVNYSVNEVFRTICVLMNKNVIPNYGDALIEPTQTLASPTKSREFLGWIPKVTLQEGIKRMLE